MNDRYTRTAICLHWLIALGLIGTFALGYYMPELAFSPTKLKLYSWHKWAGVTLFFLVLLRLGWRLGHPVPPLPTTVSPVMRFASHISHGVMYALMLAIPLSGWLMSSAKGFQTSWFGVLPLPDLLPKDDALGDRLIEVHKVLNYTLLVLVIVHTCAALKHHFIDRDNVLTRILPSKRQPDPRHLKP
ncbi:cytochrome b [Pseudomonas sp. FW306-02-F02-AA]|uniref:Cytochrome B n=1 Tax=Pseudomonas fluorescens TaxID=294 RepID=A0A0N9W1B1_PSEFL|nr:MULTISPECIES: cytochrome b [Pseudomonas]ALI04907.1 cytochrome B [Pseudomonas fluorescens]PMZ05629.1 cytochrome b [Pseudomonas sp. FW306-02-F02-AB]PMZ11198.1 cytochrome b [Pseudomonas sp. FW306-02-H06C]PMZ17153.1 cytochrome b [Pseudomonas sp. FW306-02-F02-AA]PMZ23399.1 cytochrome b [Pseudomonas sp. FW306-02-F08-AA]